MAIFFYNSCHVTFFVITTWLVYYAMKRRLGLNQAVEAREFKTYVYTNIFMQ